MGWLTQHKYGDELAIPVGGRVAAGVLSDGQVHPALDLTMFVGVLPAGKEPRPGTVEAIRQS